jgi:DNA-binding response OmpR family regulator
MTKPPSPPAVPRPGTTVLVVDDDVMVLQAVVILLEDRGFNVLAAVDGVQGLREYRTHRPDVILTDIIMPQKEGISLIRDLRREFPEAKIVAMSGGGRMGNSDYITIAKTLGADAGLNKPFDEDELIATICELLRPATPSRESSAA